MKNSRQVSLKCADKSRPIKKTFNICSGPQNNYVGSPEVHNSCAPETTQAPNNFLSEIQGQFYFSLLLLITWYQL
ncbi:hypothetical protein Y1Q_0023307 [Alligator mississippiensis]|uniref:Uncharacterized protein n=1 Tax=Alligator mississippiensis TaxID=8496 RepID=A0A151NP00_ALLMI|nr:hypothetical protein Y1Q_0023307 [Alligator mississippiensis]